MRKMKLAVESLAVQSFATSMSHAAGGTVVAHQQTMQGQHCGSAFDACNTGLCTPNCAPTYSPEACPTDPQYC